ncbi:hypothetical protein [Streptomyces sp. NPDC088736]|uniref:hypothetical protein n=1 Tax=Streptomyces sp. NPDC088736 TaxID=3365881 RepID=UPI0037FFA0F3
MFAAQDHDLVRDAIARTCPRLLTAPPEIQRRAAGRMGDLEAFWSGTDQALASQLDALVRATAAEHAQPAWWSLLLNGDEIGILALSADAQARTALPGVEPSFTALSAHKRAQVIAHRPGPYFAGYLPALMADVGSFDQGEGFARTTVLPCAPYLTMDQLLEVLAAWTANGQCWGRAMPGYLIDLFHATAHLGDARRAGWRELLASIEDDPTTYAVIASGIGEPTQPPITGA